MIESSLKHYFDRVQHRSLSQGGFVDRSQGTYRVDATAWAIILLNTKMPGAEFLKLACRQLALDQGPDGRLSISPDHPHAYWPTPLAVLAWRIFPDFQLSRDRALRFLVQSSGLAWERSANEAIGHDTSIPGWSWTEDTHSWVVPTSLTMMALTASGLESDNRVTAGERLLLDRQLPGGGWNYGNVSVFGQVLRPFPETTGMALNALSGRVSPEMVGLSLEYLEAEISRLRTPRSLGWALLGLKAWDRTPLDYHEWIWETLDRESSYGSYDTVSLCLLLAAFIAPGGLVSLLSMGQTKGNKES